MKNEIRDASAITQINTVLQEWAGQYDLDLLVLATAGIGVKSSKSVIITPIPGRPTIKEFTGHDVYYIDSNKPLAEVKEIVIQSVRYRNVIRIDDSDSHKESL